MVAKLDLLAHLVPDSGDIVDEVTARSPALDIGGYGHDQIDPSGRLLVTVLSLIAVSRPTWPGRAPVRA